MRERVVLGIALALMCGVLLTVLASGGQRLASTNSRVVASGVAVTVASGEERCEPGLLVPPEASSARLYTGAFDGRQGEPLALSISDGNAVAARADVSGGYTPGTLDVKLPRVGRMIDPATFCIRNVGSNPMAFAGNLTPFNTAALRGPNQPGERPTDAIRIDLFRTGSESWFELAPDIARRFALFKPSFVGPSTMWLCLLLLVLLHAAAIAILFKAPDQEDRRIPPAALACAVIAFANAALWAMTTPAFQVPDELSHAGYVEYLAETGRVPPLRGFERTPQLSEDYAVVWKRLPFTVEGKPSWSERHDRELRNELAEDLSRRSAGGAWTAASNPPLYYALIALPTRVASGLNTLDRLYVMRLASSVLSAVTVLFVYFFLRELLPSSPLAWVVGALAVTFQPLFGFLSGGITNDDLLFLASASALYLLARLFRRGLTVRLGLAMGVTAAVGILAKPSMIAMLPGLGVGLGLAVKASPTDKRRTATRYALAAGIVFGAITAVWLAVSVAVLGRPAIPGAAPFPTTGPHAQPTVGGALSYLWDFFVPQLPFLRDRFPGYPEYPLWDVYIEGYIGRFGYFQFGFNRGVNVIGLLLLLTIASAAGMVLVRLRRRVRCHAHEALSYGIVVAGVLIMTGLFGYRYLVAQGARFEQARYLLPLLPLYGAVVALSTRCGGPKWERSLSILVILVAMGHSLGAMLLTLARYYA